MGLPPVQLEHGALGPGTLLHDTFSDKYARRVSGLTEESISSPGSFSPSSTDRR